MVPGDAKMIAKGTLLSPALSIMRLPAVAAEGPP